MTEDEMAGWLHQIDGHELEQTPGESERWGSLACCSPWNLKDSDITLISSSLKVLLQFFLFP